MSFLKVILIAVSIYVVLNAVLYFTQELFIFQSGKKLSQDYKFQIDSSFEEVFIKPSDNTTLHGLLLKSDNSKGVILYFHGNRGSVLRWGKIVEFFLQFQYDVLVMDYRGYGKSRGERNEKLLHEDALSAYQYLEKSYDQDNIIIYGRSIGTGIATKLASEVPSKCLVLETPYLNFNDLIRRYLFIFPTHWLIKYDFRSDLFLKHVKCPVHIFHGTDDRIVPIESGLRLIEAANRHGVNFNKIDGGKHNNLHNFEVYKNEIQQILLNK